MASTAAAPISRERVPRTTNQHWGSAAINTPAAISAARPKVLITAANSADKSPGAAPSVTAKSKLLRVVIAGDLLWVTEPCFIAFGPGAEAVASVSELPTAYNRELLSVNVLQNPVQFVEVAVADDQFSAPGAGVVDGDASTQTRRQITL